MKTEQYLYNAYKTKLNEIGNALSPECKTYITSQRNYNDIIRFGFIALDYMDEIEDRYYCYESDEEDYDRLNAMVMMIGGIKDLIDEYEHIEIIIDDED